MPNIKKARFVFYESLVSEYEAIHALTIHALRSKLQFSKDEKDLLTRTLSIFRRDYDHSYVDTINKLREICPSIDKDVLDISPKELYDNYVERFMFRFNKEPVRLLVNGEYRWVFKEYIYDVKGHYSDDQIRLLILEDFDKERKYFEKLKVKFDETQDSESTYERPRIPESIRVEVWRRDGGKCARCGSREKLEYDHIVPISKGGSNTARNIELLCEKHNRSKSNNVV